ncbi:MAG: hypothetical protein JRJ12_03295 [Deltaproteobacteria bacterium]|nr:hypothetical protein [Deltaproteobacteria bacterium]MBW2069708.1 hypothetical protein [Deltaproteobacteria bacterium]
MHTLAIGRLLVDVAVLGLLCYLVFMLRTTRMSQSSAPDSQTGALMTDIRKLADDLAAHLAEKKALTEQVLAGVEERLTRMEQLKEDLDLKLTAAGRQEAKAGLAAALPREEKLAVVLERAEQGESIAEIATAVNLPVGEVALMLKVNQAVNESSKVCCSS